jgi:hypothetical protein
MSAPWTQPEIDYALKLWAEGRSAREIAVDMRASFGVVRTRNAVIGAIHRKNGGGRPKAAKPAKLATFRPAKAPRVQKTAHKPPKPGPQNRPGDVFGDLSNRPAPVVVDLAAIESPNARPWMERAPFGECKWPLGERHAILSCCNPVERGSYCEAHAAVAFVATRPPASSYVSGARFDRVEPTMRKAPSRPTTVWDEARAA